LAIGAGWRSVYNRRVPLTVAALEVPHRFGEVEAQLSAVDGLLAGLAERGVQFALLPEACLTGYLSEEFSFDLRGLAEPRGGPTERALSQLARKHRLALAGPLLERDGDRFFNSFLVHGDDGALLAWYRKRHPWVPERWHSPGREPHPLFEVAGTRCTLAICFDVHFLHREARPQLEAADVLLFPSAWCEETEGGPDQRDELLPALARRFRIAIVNANWGEGAPRLPGMGASRMVDASGEELCRTSPGAPLLVAPL
jgi:5-aminopentanamidase